MKIDAFYNSCVPAQGSLAASTSSCSLNMISSVPHVSVIVAAFNAEHFLRRCLDSILQQTLRNMEVIVIDDGSTDGTFALLESYASQHEILRIYKQANSGLAATMNRGVQLARGEYISFIDADDFVQPEMLETLSSLGTRENADVVIGGFLTLDEAGKTLRASGTRFSGLYVRDEYFHHVLSGRVSLSLRDKLIRRSLLSMHVRFADGRLYEDMDAGVVIFRNSSRIYVINGHYYRYVWHDSAITKRFSKRKVDDFVDSILRTKKYLLAEQIYSQYELEFLRGTLSRSLLFINQAVSYPNLDDGHHVFEHVLSLVRLLEEEGILTESTLAVLRTSSPKQVEPYLALLTMIRAPFEAMADHFLKSQEMAGKEFLPPRIAASSAYGLLKRSIDVVDKTFPQGSSRRWVVHATRSMLTLDYKHFDRHVAPLLREKWGALRSLGPSTPPR